MDTVSCKERSFRKTKQHYYYFSAKNAKSKDMFTQSNQAAFHWLNKDEAAMVFLFGRSVFIAQANVFHFERLDPEDRIKQ